MADGFRWIHTSPYIGVIGGLLVRRRNLCGDFRSRNYSGAREVSLPNANSLGKTPSVASENAVIDDPHKPSHCFPTLVTRIFILIMFERTRYNWASTKVEASLLFDLQHSDAAVEFFKAVLADDQFFDLVLKVRRDMRYSSWTRGIRDALDRFIRQDANLSDEQKKVLVAGQIATWIVDGIMKRDDQLDWSQIRQETQMLYEDYGLTR